MFWVGKLRGRHKTRTPQSLWPPGHHADNTPQTWKRRRNIRPAAFCAAWSPDHHRRFQCSAGPPAFHLRRPASNSAEFHPGAAHSPPPNPLQVKEDVQNQSYSNRYYPATLLQRGRLLPSSPRGRPDRPRSDHLRINCCGRSGMPQYSTGGRRYARW